MISFLRANLRDTIRIVGILLLAALTAGAWLILIQSHRTPPESDYVSPSVSAPTTTPTESPSASEAVEEPLTVAFLGDSYTTGAGSSAEDQRWTSLVAESAGWSESNFGWGGTGYVAAPFIEGEQRLAYGDRVADIVEQSPDVIIISGGRNDVGQDPALVRQEALELFTQLTEQLPETSVLVLSPWWDASEPPFEFSQIVESIRSAAEEANVSYIDTGLPLTDPALIAADGVHPNDDGYAAIAEAVTAALSRL
ncbi:SGNH/GDSL hydrolase family protein [Agrococcus casei]|uniref:POSSIBLE EXPORTED PROTEIN n=2 Tax=Agrococcus TaxID=46352 RepID=A0A1R4G6P3_9MICO|nr:SGNH/GDSL hydrolase family protein [Agrococcus casei]SJM63763.1 POSSIBLE EXPORTED PROTEIN [Agrococcus casei LMG 22410]